MAMYNGVRGLILSDGDESRVGTGIAALNIEETAQDAAAGYVSKTGLYYVQAGFRITGTDFAHPAFRIKKGKDLYDRKNKRICPRAG